MQMEVTMPARTFETTVETGERGRVFITIPFNPQAAWGKQSRYYVSGTINGTPYSGSLGVRNGVFFMPVNKEIQQAAGIAPCDNVSVTMDADAAQEADTPVDLAQAFSSAPEASEFFDSLTPFQRNTYVKWITGAKQSDTRATRVEESIKMLRAGKKQA
jgi:hypothetical protein